MGASRLPARARQFLTTRRADLICLGVIVVVAVAFFSPALHDGGVLGGLDLDSGLTSLTRGLYASVHSNANGDAASQMVAWNALDWRLVHAGHFPLWNDYSVLGMPEFLNFESSVLSLPDLVSYAVPLRDAFLVAAIVKLLIAGTGSYLAARVLSLRPVSALFAGLTFMLSGAFVNWITWPLSDVVCWCGYLLAFSVLAYRFRRWRDVVLLAVSVAFSIYGGFPEGNVMIALAAVFLALGAGIAALVVHHRLDLRAALRPVLGAVCGVALAAPLWLAGTQLISLSHRTHDAHYVGLPTSTFALLFAQGYDGLPNGPAFSNYAKWPYYESVSYVGVIAVVLALVAVLSCWRRPLVVGLTVALVVTFAATYEPRDLQLFFGIVNRIPQLSAVRFERIRTVSAFLLSLLGAVGLDELVKHAPALALRRVYVAATLLVSGVVAYLLVDSQTVRLRAITRHARLVSLVWPVVLCGALLVLGLGLRRLTTSPRLRQLVAGSLVPAEGAFLFTAAVGVPTYGHLLYAPTAATTRLASIVGNNLVGLDNGNTGEVVSCGGNTYGVRTFTVKNAGCAPQPSAGFYPNLNVGYGIHLYGVHDPLTPAEYYATWPVRAAAPVNNGVGLFVPAITSATLARRYGIGYILTPDWVAPPTGTDYVTTLAGNERLYAVPGGARFSFPGGGGVVLRVTDGGDGSFALTTRTTRDAQIFLGVTALPGWHLNIDGKSVAITRANGVAEAAMIPAGVHRLTLDYLPGRLVDGLYLALAAALVLLGAGLLPLFAKRRRNRPVPDAG